MQIRDHIFLVTGAASGLGEACARRLIDEGAHVVLADLQEDAGARLADELGERARFSRADVTQTADVEQAIQAAAQLGGVLHGVVHCAGMALARRVVGRDGPHDLASFARVVEVNLVGTFNVVRLAAEMMSVAKPNTEGERGVIITTASAAAYEGQIGQAAYAASKGGVAAMTLPLARELARFGVRVMAVAPGIFDTPMMAGMSDEVRASLAAQIPFPQRLGRPAEFAVLAQHLIENPMLNGEVIRLDGAMRMAPK